MNKFFTVISLLFIVTYASCTQKVSYSDIVSSFAELTHVEGAEHVYNGIKTEFENSVHQLEAYDNALQNECSNIVSRSNAHHNHIEENIANANKSVQEMKENILQLNLQMTQNENDRKHQMELRHNLQQELKEGAENVQQVAMDMVERNRILKRLQDLVQDELHGAQRHSTVGNFHVDKKLSGYSFVEVHNQLKELESKDPIVKSMISTLVLITQDQNDVFANQETVGKILHMIDNLIKQGQKHMAQVQHAFEEKSAHIHKSLHHSANAMLQAGENYASHRASVQMNTQQIKFVNQDVAGMQDHARRCDARRVSNIDMCKKLQRQSANVRKGLADAANRFEHLRKLIA